MGQVISFFILLFFCINLWALDPIDESIFFLTTPDPMEFQTFDRGNIFSITLTKELRKDLLYTILLHLKSQYNLDILRVGSYSKTGAVNKSRNIIIRHNGSQQEIATDIRRLLDIKEILSISTVVGLSGVEPPESWKPVEYSDKVVPFRRVNKQKTDLSGLVVFKPAKDFSSPVFSGTPVVTVTHSSRPFLYLVKTNPICHWLFR